jgi:cell division septum initiation protein DivIVA
MGHTDRPSFVGVRRGYDRVEVDKYLDSLEDSLETLRSHVEKLEAELEVARQREETALAPSIQARYTAVSDHAAQVMQALDDEVERLRTHANEEAERMLSKARADADRIQRAAESKANEVRSSADDALKEARQAAHAIQGDARGRAEETLAAADTLMSEARQEADRTLLDLEHRRRSIYGKLRRTRSAIDQALSDLDSEIEEEEPANELILLTEEEGSRQTSTRNDLSFRRSIALRISSVADRLRAGPDAPSSVVRNHHAHLSAASVGAGGLEPPASCSQSRRATRLRYAP